MKPFHAQFLLYPGFSNMVLACALEPLRAVRDLLPGAVSWEVLTLGDAPTASSSGLTLTPDTTLNAAGRADLLVALSSYGYSDHTGAVANSSLRKLARQARLVAGVDTGAWLLAAAGILDKRRATIHWQTAAEFEEAFPRIELAHDRFVQDGTIWSAGGASATLDMMLALIEDTFGAGIAFDVSTLFVHDAERREQGPARLASKGSVVLRSAVARMVETIETPLALSRLARDVGVSERSLTRLFTNELSLSPGKYYQSLRLARARDLAASGRYPLSEIALRTGFASAATLARAFSAHFGQTLGQAKRTKRR